MVSLFKYIFQEEKDNGFKSMIAVIIRLAAFTMSLSPVFIYFLLYQYDLFKKFNITISCILIFGCSCIWFSVFFSFSQAYASCLLTKKLISNPNMSMREKEDYYFEKSFKVNTLFQMLLTILLILTYSYYHSEYVPIKAIKELKLVIIVISVFVILSLIIWSILLILKILSKSSNNSSKDNNYLDVNKNKINININTYNEKS